jgi:hypothetical protein
MDYCKDPAMVVAQNDQGTIVDGKKIVKHSIRGWELCYKWKDGSTSWQKSNLKWANPLQGLSLHLLQILLMNQHLTGG